MIYATVGTMYMDFPRLIQVMDAVALASGEEVIVQTGLGNTLPQHCEHFDFKSRDEVLAIQAEARVIVCHAGIGSVIDALQMKKPLIVVPRLKQFAEHNSDHQLELAQAVERRGWGRMIEDISELAEACAHPPDAYTDYVPAKQELIDHLRARLLEK